MANFIDQLLAGTTIPPSNNGSQGPYWLGEAWTPTPDQIRQARERHQVYRQQTQWRRLGAGPELDAARAAIVWASRPRPERQSPLDPKAAARLRMVRKLALDPGAQFFARNLLVSSDHYLLEFRHPFLRRNDTTQGVGLRFIGLAHEAWARSDDIGVMLDGSRQPHELWKSLFGSGWEETFRKAELAEAYIRFALDHTEFNGEQLYVVSDRSDFKTTSPLPDDHDREYLTAQFQVSLPPTQGEMAPPGESERFLSALRLGEESQIVPPTILRTIQQAGTVPEHGCPRI